MEINLTENQVIFYTDRGGGEGNLKKAPFSCLYFIINSNKKIITWFKINK